jgi:hypothetical protein
MQNHDTIADSKQRRPHVRKPPMKIIIEEWDGGRLKQRLTVVKNTDEMPLRLLAR